jgi:hypothetical protein
MIRYRRAAPAVVPGDHNQLAVAVTAEAAALCAEGIVNG